MTAPPVTLPLPTLVLPTLNGVWLQSLHRAPIPEDEPIPGEQPEPEEDPVPHPDPVIREPDQPSSVPMSVKDQRGGLRNSTWAGA